MDTYIYVQASDGTPLMPTKRFNDTGRDLPGVEFFHNSKRYIKSGQSNGGFYIQAEGQGKTNFPASECRIVKKNSGLVYLS